MDRSQRLVWLDLAVIELDRPSIAEIATVVTEPTLELVAEGPCLILQQPEHVLASMPTDSAPAAWVEKVRASTISLGEAESQTLAFVEQYCDQGSPPLCGNLVWKDRVLLKQAMPAFLSFLHYRIIELTTIRQLVERWCPDKAVPPPAIVAQSTLDNIYQSLEELRWYRRHLFTIAGETHEPNR